MHKRKLLLALAVVAVGISAVVWLRQSGSNRTRSNDEVVAQQQPAILPAPEIPAHYTSPPSRDSLAPTLPPQEFFGKAKEAYSAARAIPQTLAQLPCYCHCDRGMGHKSLHSCFEDDHAAHCAVCVDEALLAYRLEKEEKLTPAQVREVIIEKYSATKGGH
jgi:hypothetical protein